MRAKSPRRKKAPKLRLPTIALEASYAAAIRATRAGLQAAEEMYATAELLTNRERQDVDDALTKAMQACEHLERALDTLELLTLPRVARAA